MIRRAIPLFLATVQACAAGPVAWSDSVQTLGAVAAPVPAGVPPQLGSCASSLSAVGADSRGPVHAAWWSLRPDGSADLMASSSDGRSWTAPIRVDTADVGKSGCDRPPPAIAVDGANVHIVYSMRAREGPGIFLTHSMDRGALFHSPVAVVYGEKPGLASVAAHGNFVVVAYEDPNTSPTRISVAISTTMAHLFDYREVVSPPGGSVANPRVATDGESVLVSWVRVVEPAVHIARKGAVR